MGQPNACASSRVFKTTQIMSIKEKHELSCQYLRSDTALQVRKKLLILHIVEPPQLDRSTPDCLRHMTVRTTRKETKECQCKAGCANPQVLNQLASSHTFNSEVDLVERTPNDCDPIC